MKNKIMILGIIVLWCAFLTLFAYILFQIFSSDVKKDDHHFEKICNIPGVVYYTIDLGEENGVEFEAKLVCDQKNES